MLHFFRPSCISLQFCLSFGVGILVLFHCKSERLPGYICFGPYVLDAVFDSGTDSSSPTFSSTGEDIEELMTPARPRTTDDLFAVIHRYPASQMYFF